MKKSIIAAGAASVALAAMPIVGVFADDVTTQVDTLSIELGTTCTFDSVSHTAGTAAEATSWSAATGNSTLSAKAIAGALYENIGSTTFNIVCNNKKGWNVTTDGASVALAGKTTASETIGNGTPAANTTAWSFTPSQAEGGKLTLGATNASPVATYGLTEAGNDGKDSASGNKSFTVTYAVSTASSISAQTYEGAITYTLNQINS